MGQWWLPVQLIYTLCPYFSLYPNPFLHSVFQRMFPLQWSHGYQKLSFCLSMTCQKEWYKSHWRLKYEVKIYNKTYLMFIISQQQTCLYSSFKWNKIIESLRRPFWETCKFIKKIIHYFKLVQTDRTFY